MRALPCIDIASMSTSHHVRRIEVVVDPSRAALYSVHILLLCLRAGASLASVLSHRPLPAALLHTFLLFAATSSLHAMASPMASPMAMFCLGPSLQVIGRVSALAKGLRHVLSVSPAGLGVSVAFLLIALSRGDFLHVPCFLNHLSRAVKRQVLSDMQCGHLCGDLVSGPSPTLLHGRLCLLAACFVTEATCVRELTASHLRQRRPAWPCHAFVLCGFPCGDTLSEPHPASSFLPVDDCFVHLQSLSSRLKTTGTVSCSTMCACIGPTFRPRHCPLPLLFVRISLHLPLAGPKTCPLHHLY